MRCVLAVALVLAAACGRNAPSPVSTTTKPRLVVLVVIDQWPSWVFAEQRAVFTGGIGRLLREGAVVPRAEIPYAGTFTAPGHATLATGAPPRVHGVFGNYWYRRDEGRDRPVEYDPSALPFAVAPPYGNATVTADDGASGRALRVDGVADALRTGTGGTGKSIAIAIKSRSACLVAGRHPDLAVWYEAGAGGMTTSTAYAAVLPPWLAELATSHPPSRYFAARWDARDTALLARITKLPDAAPGESGRHGFDASFPHALADSDHPEHAIRFTPFADELVAHTVAVALDALDLGRDEHPDFLAISFGAHDLAGHEWGPDSWEVLDLTLRLDALLGKLFATLDARLGEDGWAVIVTSDHGATPVVERARVRSARRIPPQAIEAAAERAVAEVAGDGPWVARFVASNLYFTPKLATLPDDARGRALDAAVAAVMAVPGIAVAGRMDRLATDCTAEQGIQQAACESRVPEDSGELYAYPAAGSVVTTVSYGTGHDAPFDDNREVPILVKAPGLAPQEGTGTLLQVAPTLAALLGVDPPSAATAPTLFGIQRQ